MHLDYGNYRVLKPHAWTQGPVLLQMLALLKGFDLDKLAPTDPDFIHIWVECAKLAYADREAFYGDPEVRRRADGDAAVGALQRGAAQARRRARPRWSSAPGKIEGYDGARDRQGRARGRRPAPASRRLRALHTGHGADEQQVDAAARCIGDTVHIDIIDKAGNMFTATPSGGWLQSSPVIPALGWPLGSRGQMFWLEEGLPGSLAPGKRPRSTLSVGMALARRQALHELGHARRRPAGPVELPVLPAPCQPGSAEPKMNLQEAIDAPAWHIEHFPLSFWPRTARPGVLVVEGRLPKATIKELERRGHKVEVGPDWSEGRLSAASQDGVRRKAAANARGMQGYAAGR